MRVLRVATMMYRKGSENNTSIFAMATYQFHLQEGAKPLKHTAKQRFIKTSPAFHHDSRCSCDTLKFES